MSSDLSRILQLLQQPQGHTSCILGTPASSDLALFPDTSVTPSAEPRPLVGHSAQVRDEGIPRVAAQPQRVCGRIRSCISCCPPCDLHHQAEQPGQGAGRALTVVTDPTAQTGGQQDPEVLPPP